MSDELLGKVVGKMRRHIPKGADWYPSKIVHDDEGHEWLLFWKDDCNDTESGVWVNVKAIRVNRWRGDRVRTFSLGFNGERFNYGQTAMRLQDDYPDMYAGIFKFALLVHRKAVHDELVTEV